MYSIWNPYCFCNLKDCVSILMQFSWHYVQGCILLTSLSVISSKFIQKFAQKCQYFTLIDQSVPLDNFYITFYLRTNQLWGHYRKFVRTCFELVKHSVTPYLYTIWIIFNSCNSHTYICTCFIKNCYQEFRMGISHFTALPSHHLQSSFD